MSNTDSFSRVFSRVMSPCEAARANGTLRRVSLSQIHYFVAVAEEGHVGRAAQRLYVAQPAVSRQIRALEDEIGTPLFERTPRGMTLLAPGRVFLERARAILKAVEDAANAARAEGALLASDSNRAVGARRSAGGEKTAGYQTIEARCPKDVRRSASTSRLPMRSEDP